MLTQEARPDQEKRAASRFDPVKPQPRVYVATSTHAHVSGLSSTGVPQTPHPFTWKTGTSAGTRRSFEVVFFNLSKSESHAKGWFW